MLTTSRTVARGKIVGLEFLRIVERDGGAPPIDFVLTVPSGTRAVYENPRHDSPESIEYELSTGGGLANSNGFAKRGRPQRFEFK